MKILAAVTIAAARAAFAARNPTLRVAVAALIALVALASPTWAQITITTNTTINAGDTTLDNQDVIVKGATLTINGPHPLASLKVINNGVVTCAALGDANYVNGLDLGVTGDLTIQSGSRIHADEKGYDSGQGPGGGKVNSSGRGGGGSYGGEGSYRYLSEGIGGAVYGNIQNPTQSGSGGATGNGGADAGGRGGGLIRLSVSGTLTVDGGILANGQSYRSGYGGGGSGGGIYISTTMLAGAGTIFANGGRENGYNGGAGGGGRIAILYQNKSGFTGNVLALAELSNDTWAGAGTVYFKGPGQQYGDLLVDNAGRESYDGNAVGGLDQLGTPLNQEETFDNVTIQNAGCLVPPKGQLLKLHVLQNMTIVASGRIRAGGRGFDPGKGPGAGTENPNQRGGGGAFGGEAVYRYISEGTNANLYGDLRDPNSSEMEAVGKHLGSGGGTGRFGLESGGFGGGGIRVVVDGILALDGVITANGEGYRSNWGGGGSGGSVYLNVGTLSGAGGVFANGGRMSGRNGGAGSGGRIAIHYGAKGAFNGNVQALGNLSNDTWAGAGTVFFKSFSQPNGDLIVDNNNNYSVSGSYQSVIPATLLDKEETFDNIRIIGRGCLSPYPMQRLILNVIGDCDILNGWILAQGKGYSALQGPGQGSPSGTNYASGSSYGGVGRTGSNGIPPGVPYGTKQLVGDPIEQLFGSGGAHGIGDPVGRRGGYGGGAIWLKVNGTLRVDAYLTANGGNSLDNDRGSGGTGGSLLIRAGFLTGNGEIYAEGANGSSGGRVALYTINSDFPDSRIFGAAVNPTGTQGTLYKETIGGNLSTTLQVSSTILAGGQGAVGQVSLSGPAPEGGLSIALLNSDPVAVSIPPSVFIPQGETNATFAITANSVTANRTATIGARLWDGLSQTNITVKPWLLSMSVSPASVNGGQSATGLLKLNVPAPAGGLTVNLASADPAVTVPATITVPGGATGKQFAITTSSVSATKRVNLTLTYLGESRTGQVIVNPGDLVVKSLTFSPASVLGGQRATGIISLSGKAPAGGVVVALASGDASVVPVPATVTIAAGKSSASFASVTGKVTSDKSVPVTATLGGSSVVRVLTVSVPKIASLELVPSTVFGGETSIGVVTLNSPTPVPVTITIASNDGAATPEQQIIIPAGQQVGSFFIDTDTVTSTKIASITVTANGSAKTKMLTITP